MHRKTEHSSGRFRRSAVLIILCALVGVGTYALAQSPKQPPTSLASQKALLQWLHVSDAQREQVQQADPDFEQDARQLVVRLKAERAELAERLRDPASTNQTLREYLDRAMTTEAALEHLVADHVLRIRPILDADQQQKLLGLVAEGLEKNAGPHLR